MELLYPVIDRIPPQNIPLTQEGFLEKFHRNDYDFRNMRFEDVDLGGLDLAEFRLQGSDLRFARNLSKAYCIGAVFTWCDLRGCDLSYTNLSQAVFHGTRLQYSNLSRANCLRTNFAYAKLQKATCTKTIFTEANLSHVQLNRANLSRARLSHTNLSRADLSWANASWCDFSDSNLAHIRLWGTNLSHALLSSKDMEQARGATSIVASPGMNLWQLFRGRYPNKKKQQEWDD
jgi:uncharacterized protein YjbI with pentapeptide repeats